MKYATESGHRKCPTLPRKTNSLFDNGLPLGCHGLTRRATRAFHPVCTSARVAAARSTRGTRWRAVELGPPRLRPSPGASRRPRPFLRPLNQPAPDRILMDVPYFLRQVVTGDDVSVVSAARLPEPVRPVRRRRQFQTWITALAPCAQQSRRHGSLDRHEDLRHGRRGPGHDQQMDMLGHEHPRDQTEPETRAGPHQLIGDRVSDVGLSQQRTPLIARACQAARVIRLLDPSSRLAM